MVSTTTIGEDKEEIPLTPRYGNEPFVLLLLNPTMKSIELTSKELLVCVPNCTSLVVVVFNYIVQIIIKQFD